MSTAPQPAKILVLTGGLIHLVHQLEVARTLDRRGADPVPITILVTGVLRKQPEALAALHREIERWVPVLRQRLPVHFSGLRLLHDQGELEPHGWGWALVNSQWLQGQRELVRQLAIRQMVVCGDGLGVYYRCARELRAIAPSLLGLPMPEENCAVRYIFNGRQPYWHRPPLPAESVSVEGRHQLFATLVEALRERGEAEVAECLRYAMAGRRLWLCSVPNLAHQFPGQLIPQAVLRAWCRDLQRLGFDPGIDRLLLVDHPKAPPEGSFGPLRETWLPPPLRSSLPLEVLIQLLREARPAVPIVVGGMTSALYGVRELTGAQVSWLPLSPLWRHNPLYRRKPMEFLHRSVRKLRMQWLTNQLGRH